MLQDAFTNIERLMNDILCYAGYARTLKLEHGNEQKKMNDAGSALGVTWGSVSGAYNRGKELFKLYPKNVPMVGINSKMLFDYMNNPKVEYEIAVFLGFLALKSIIGNKSFIRTTNEFMIARMGGYARISDMPDPLPQPLSKYTTRRMLDKIKLDLQHDWNINYYPSRGFYVSMDHKFTLDKLALAAEKKASVNKQSLIKQKIEEAKIKALSQLGTIN